MNLLYPSTFIQWPECVWAPGASSFHGSIWAAGLPCFYFLFASFIILWTQTKEVKNCVEGGGSAENVASNTSYNEVKEHLWHDCSDMIMLKIVKSSARSASDLSLPDRPFHIYQPQLWSNHVFQLVSHDVSPTRLPHNNGGFQPIAFSQLVRHKPTSGFFSECI